jgi:hypothetical protein
VNAGTRVKNSDLQAVQAFGACYSGYRLGLGFVRLVWNDLLSNFGIVGGWLHARAACRGEAINRTIEASA